MNICILMGKIIDKIEFKFIINSKNKSIAFFDMKLLNQSIIRINAYNDMADYIYRKFDIGQNVIIEGILRGDGSIECKRLKIY